MNTHQPDSIENYKMRSSRSRTRSQLSNEKVFNKIFTTLKKAILIVHPNLDLVNLYLVNTSI